MNDFINELNIEFSDELKKVVGYTTFKLTVNETSPESGDLLSRKGENSLCNLVTDSFRILGEADISIMNTGTLRSDIEPGNIIY